MGVVVGAAGIWVEVHARRCPSSSGTVLVLLVCHLRLFRLTTRSSQINYWCGPSKRFARLLIIIIVMDELEHVYPFLEALLRESFHLGSISVDTAAV